MASAALRSASDCLGGELGVSSATALAFFATGASASGVAAALAARRFFLADTGVFAFGLSLDAFALDTLGLGLGVGVGVSSSSRSLTSESPPASLAASTASSTRKSASPSDSSPSLPLLSPPSLCEL